MRARLLRTYRSCGRRTFGITPMFLLTALVSVGCSKSGLNSAGTDGAAPDLPTGTGGDSGWDPGLPTIRVSASVLDFGTVEVGSSSPPQVVTVTVSAALVTMNPTVIGPGFAISGTTCTNPQPPGACTVSVSFAPVTIGAATGTLAVANAAVALAGAGTSHPTFSTTDRVDLGTVQINQTAPVVIQVNTSSALSMTCMASAPDLTLASQTCPTSGPISAPCTFTFAFKSSTLGVKNASVVCSSGGTVTQTVVTATVVTGASPTINPPTASLVTSVGGSTVTTFTLANAGGSPTGDLTAAITAGASDFAIVSNECTGALAPMATCRIQVAFKPASVGAKTGTLTVTDKASGQSGTAALTGTSMTTGGYPITPATHDFGRVTVGASDTFSFTVRNNGGVAGDIIDFAGGSSEFIIDGQTCKGGALAPASRCTFAVTFAPKDPPGAGVRTAAIVLTEAGVAKAMAQVSGTAVAAVRDAGTDAETLDSNPVYAACFDCGKFAATPVGQTSPEVTCTGQAAPPDGGIAAMNVQLNSRDFAIVNASCTASKCTVTLVFKPTVQGRQVGTLSAVNMDVEAGCGVDFEATGL